MWYVVNNVTGTVLPRGYDTEPIAERMCASLNTPAAGGLYGVVSDEPCPACGAGAFEPDRFDCIGWAVAHGVA